MPHIKNMRIGSWWENWLLGWLTVADGMVAVLTLGRKGACWSILYALHIGAKGYVHTQD